MQATLPPDQTLDPTAPGRDDEWPTASTAKGLRVRLPVALAALAAVALFGVWGGATLKDDSPTPNGLAGGRPGAASGPTGAFPGGGFGGARPGGAFPGGGVQGEVIRVDGVQGEVIRVDGDRIVIRGTDGNEQTVIVDEATTISETTAAEAGDIGPGDTIAARGTTTDGATQAQSIVLNPTTPSTGGARQFPGAPAGSAPGR